MGVVGTKVERGGRRQAGWSLEREGDIQTRTGRKRDHRGKKSRTGPDRIDSYRTGAVHRTGPVRFGPVRFGSIQIGSVRYGPDRTGPVRNGPYRDGLERFGPELSGPERFGPEWFGAERCELVRRTDAVRSGPDQDGLKRSGPEQSGPERFVSERFGLARGGPNRKNGVVRTEAIRTGAVRNGGLEDRIWCGSDRSGTERPLRPCGERQQWRSAVCGVGRYPLFLPGVAHPLFLTGGWAQQQGEKEDGGHPLFVPGREGDEQGKGARGEEMVWERGRDTGIGRPSGNFGHRRMGCGRKHEIYKYIYTRPR